MNEALLMIELNPTALQHSNTCGSLPIHLEFTNKRRQAIISKCIELYPESLGVSDTERYLPLHSLLASTKSSLVENTLMVIEKYPAAVSHKTREGKLPLHLECSYRCRSAIISKRIELYPEALLEADFRGNLPLHGLLRKKSSTVNDAQMMIDKYPELLQHWNHQGQSCDRYDHLPLHIECEYQCRSVIISKCIELYAEALDDQAISIIVEKSDENDFCALSSVLSIIFTARPMSLCDRYAFLQYDIRDDPYYRRRLLNMLPRKVLTPRHEADNRDLIGITERI
jgi:hypothetical protein